MSFSIDIKNPNTNKVTVELTYKSKSITIVFIPQSVHYIVGINNINFSGSWGPDIFADGFFIQYDKDNVKLSISKIGDAREKQLRVDISGKKLESGLKSLEMCLCKWKEAVKY